MAKRKNLSLNLLALFILGSLCSSLFAIPDSTTVAAQREAWLLGCAPDSSSSDNAEGEKTDYFCASGSYPTFAFQAPAVYSSVHNFFKDGLSLIRPVLAESSDRRALGASLSISPALYPGQKVSPRLLNSVLNL